MYLFIILLFYVNKQYINISYPSNTKRKKKEEYKICLTKYFIYVHEY